MRPGQEAPDELLKITQIVSSSTSFNEAGARSPG